MGVIVDDDVVVFVVCFADDVWNKSKIEWCYTFKDYGQTYVPIPEFYSVIFSRETLQDRTRRLGHKYCYSTEVRVQLMY